MVEQYPHTITHTAVEDQTEPYQDTDSNWVIPEPGAATLESYKANAHPNGKGAKLKTRDGQLLEFAYLVILPGSAPKLIVGETITIKDGAEIICTGIVQGYFKGQFNTTLWV